MRKFLLEPFVMLATVVQWLLLATLTGMIVGSGVSLFLLALFALTDPSIRFPLWLQMLLLPLGGLANGLLLYYGYRLSRSSLKDSIMSAAHEQNGRMPLATIFIKPLATLITLSCGGSAGKEGPCSHLGASLASAIGQVLRVNTELRKRLVACGVSAGFASVFGTPIAGAIYGVELLAIGRIRHDFVLPAVIGGVVSWRVSQFWGVPYDTFHIPFPTTETELFLLKTVLIGILCGLVARLYVDGCQYTKDAFQALREHFSLWPPLLPVIGGCILAVSLLVLPTDYLGLSLPLMESALAGQSIEGFAFFWKCAFVALTLGSGFYGGVVTPQFVIGAAAGNVIAPWLGISPAVGAAIGLVAVVAAASNTPIAAILMGIELFGTDSLLVTTAAVMCAYLLIGHRSIYPDQRLAYSKTSWIQIRPDLPIGREKLHLSYVMLRWWKHRKRKKESKE